jgi:drug/metabolite transporter (DMT)-like permease
VDGFLLDSLHPNISALIAAVFVASARTCYRGALSVLSPAATTIISLALTVGVAWSYYYLSGGVEAWPLRGLLWFAAVGLFGSLGARYISLLSINLVGLARGSIVVQSSLIWSAMMAFFFVGERITWGVGLGTIAIMLGSIILVYERTPAREAIPLRYFSVPLLVALCLATSHLFLRFGFSWIPSVPLGMGISSSTALLVILLVIPFTKERIPRSWGRHPIFIVVLGSLCNAVAAVFFQAAVKNGKMVEVIPVNRLSVLLIIFFSWFFFRKQEAVTGRVVIGGILSVAGAWAIVSK